VVIEFIFYIIAYARKRFRGFRRFKGFRGEGIAAFGGDEYLVSVTGFAFMSPLPHDVVLYHPSGGRDRTIRHVPYCFLPADRYVTAVPALTNLTEILRFVETLQRVSKSAEVGP
jgi:hypothetical protein